jgi:uncharacterized repeat protein (TIGR01451 family)
LVLDNVSPVDILNLPIAYRFVYLFLVKIVAVKESYMKKFTILIAFVMVMQIAALGTFAASSAPVVEDDYKPASIIIDVTQWAKISSSYWTDPNFLRESSSIVGGIVNNMGYAKLAKENPGSVRLPVVYHSIEGKVQVAPPPKGITLNSKGNNPFKIQSTTALPAGTITWEFTTSCSSGATPPSPLFDCASEMPYINDFIVPTGTGTWTAGMNQCIRDVFGAPFYTIKVRFVRDDALPAGVAGQYWSSGGSGTGQIHIPTAIAAPPNNPLWGATVGEHMLSTLTHEMIHAYYDDMNLYYHAWSEGLTECQSVLARKLFCQRNSYTPTTYVHLSWGIPPYVSLYELNNQEGLPGAQGWFYTSVPGQRILSMMNTRYGMAAAYWWKIYRETIPVNSGTIDTNILATYGTNAFFSNFNGRLFDGWSTYMGTWSSYMTNWSLHNTYVSATLTADKGNANVENQDFESTWFGKQEIIQIRTKAILHLYFPYGPITPMGGYPIPPGLSTNICDLGSMFGGYVGGGPGYLIAGGNSACLYVTQPGGFEVPVDGTATVTVTSLHGQGGVAVGQNVTARVGYRPAFDNGAPPAAWAPIPPALTFSAAADGRFPEYNSPNFIAPAGLNFNWPGAPGGALPTGGYMFQIDATSGTQVAQQICYFASGYSNNFVHTGVVIGSGTTNGDQFAVSLNSSGWVDYTNTTLPPWDPAGAAPPRAAFSGFYDGATYSHGGIIGYRFRANGAAYYDYDYANGGMYYYVKNFITSFNRLTQTLPPYIGRYGFALISQSTDFLGGADPTGDNHAGLMYYEKFCSESSQPSTTGLSRLVYRPDYIPDGSRPVACFLYANTVGRNNGGVYEERPLRINQGVDPDWHDVYGLFLGRDDEPLRNSAPGGCACGGWSPYQSTFRFDLTPYINDCFDTIRITNLYQAYEPNGQALFYGFEMVLIYENPRLELSQIMIADGALRICANERPQDATTFTGFRTPPTPATWPRDRSQGSAYMAILGNSADNGSGGNGRINTEWDFWAVGTDRRAMDRIWINPEPADPVTAESGAWYTPGDPNGFNAAQNINCNQRPADFPNPYFFWSRPINNNPANFSGFWGGSSACKQFSSAWFWCRNFTTVANKTALVWEPGSWWDVVNSDYNAGPHNTDSAYLAGDDTSVTIRPYMVCSNAVDPDPLNFNDGFGPCVGTWRGNQTGANCQAPIGTDYWARSDERGHLQAIILQVPIIPSLELTKTGVPEPVLPGNLIIYTITVRNATPYLSQGVRVVETYPVGTTFFDANPPPDTGNNEWTTSIGTNGDGSLNPNEEMIIVVRLRVNKLPKGTKLTNVVMTYSETSPAPVYAEATNTVLGEPKLVISKYTKKFMALQGDKVKFYINVKNVGDREATGVAVYDLLPREFSYDSSLPSGSVGLSKIYWSLGTINPGQSVLIELILKIRDDILINPGSTLTNTAFATSLEDLFVQDSAIVLVRSSGSGPVVCPKPDVSLLVEGLKPEQGPDGLFWNFKSGQEYNISIKVYDNGGCSPYELTVNWGDGSPEELYTMRDGDSVMTKELKPHSFTTGEKIIVRLKNRYDGQYDSTFKYKVK